MGEQIGFSKNIVRFSGFTESKTKNKTAVMGEKLWKMMLNRDPDFGGWLVEINGIMGSGKTSLMLGMLTNILKKNPEETIFWREAVNNPLQISKLGGFEKVQFLSEKNYLLDPYEFQGKELVISEDINIKYFSGVKDLINKSKHGMVNVVYFKSLYKWADLIMQLRFDPNWQTIFIDEMEDVTPQRATNKGGDNSWSKNEELSGMIKEIRKNRVSLIYNTQIGSSDVDSRIRGKAMMFFYLYGSKYDKSSPISRGALHNLQIGTAWIDYGHSQWGRIRFQPFKPIGKQYLIIPRDK